MSREVVSLPQGIVQWIPFLWSHVLFPSKNGEPSAIRSISLLTLLILPAFLLFPTRSYYLLEPDEGRYAELTREMLQNEEWIIPTLQSEPYLDKPPLFYWLIILSYKLFGVSDSVARLVPALSVHFIILCVYLFGRRTLGERSAFWGALLLSVSPGMMGMGRLLILDGLLTLWITLATFSLLEAIRGSKLHQGWWFFAAIACGLGVLTKGPIACLLPIPPVIAYRWLTRSRIEIGWKRWCGFFGIVLSINLPWYIAIYLHEPIFLKYFFWEHNVLRFLQPFDHLQPVWYYLPILIGGLFPAIVLAWPFLKSLVSGEEESAQRRTKGFGYYLLAGCWCVFFFSVSGCKLPTYILPTFPLFTLLLGDFIARSNWKDSLWTKSGIPVMIGLLGFIFYVGLPWYAEHRSPMRQAEEVRKLCSDPTIPVFCYPRNCDSVAFYLERDDFQNVRSKFSQTLIEALLEYKKSVVLFTHRHSHDAFKHLLPPNLHITQRFSYQQSEGKQNWLEKLAGSTPWGLCDIVVVEKR
jgi:4-amino-4-deoxy-L-arabinose transferase-like glycosyltransferase